VDFLHSCGTPWRTLGILPTRILDTWDHDHRTAPSLWSEGEYFHVPDQSCLGRVGV
jgi:hypothetical protein